MLGEGRLRQLARRGGLEVVSIANQAVPLAGTGGARAALHLLLLAARAGLELPLQLLLNSYYPGDLRWRPLGPNLVARLRRPEEDR